MCKYYFTDGNMSILYQIEYRILRNTCHFRGKTIYAQARTNGCPRKVKTEPITFFSLML